MGLLDRIHRLQGDETPDILEAPVVPDGPRKVKIDAMLGVLIRYLPDERDDEGVGRFAGLLFAIARKELAGADEAKLDFVILGILDAAERLRPLLGQAPQAPPGEASA